MPSSRIASLNSWRPWRSWRENLLFALPRVEGLAEAGDELAQRAAEQCELGIEARERLLGHVLGRLLEIEQPELPDRAVGIQHSAHHRAEFDTEMRELHAVLDAAAHVGQGQIDVLPAHRALYLCAIAHAALAPQCKFRR